MTARAPRTFSIEDTTGFFLPLKKLAREGWPPLASYLAVNAIVVGALLLVTPAAGLTQVSMAALHRQTMFWGYIHITGSFALSSHNPAPVRRLLDYQM